MRTTVRAGAKLRSVLGRGEGVEGAEFQAGAHAPHLLASGVRACVRVCVWSQFPPSAALPDWGSERPLSFVPGVPSFLTPGSSPSARTPCFRQACPRLRTRRHR